MLNQYINYLIECSSSVLEIGQECHPLHPFQVQLQYFFYITSMHTNVNTLGTISGKGAQNTHAGIVHTATHPKLNFCILTCFCIVLIIYFHSYFIAMKLENYI